MKNTEIHKKFRGCLIGGAVGDALGAPVEFISHVQSVRQFGKDGIHDYIPAFGKLGAITDDTQMTLFSAEGILRGYVRSCTKGISTFTGVLGHAYLRWLETQGYKSKADIEHDGWLWEQRELHSPRAPGLTCLSSLKNKDGYGSRANNDSKGCGGVMRVAPIGLFGYSKGFGDSSTNGVFDRAVEAAALTHGHPSGQLPAVVLAVLVLRSVQGIPLLEALTEAKALLRAREHHDETMNALNQAEALAASGQKPRADLIEQLGGGWVAEEALAIGVYCALVAKDFEHGITLAVNHGGDSDSTGSIAGNLLGAALGIEAIPERWIQPLELKDVIAQVADDLFDFQSWDLDNYDKSEENAAIWKKYPGC